MKPNLLLVPVGPNRTFSVRHNVVPNFLNCWHYHAELELVHIVKGTGMQFVGTSVKPFKPDDLVLVGSNLPHYWKCDAIYFENHVDLNVESKVVHFSEDFLGADFKNLPENKILIELYTKAYQGIKITGKTKLKIVELMGKLQVIKDMKSILVLLEILFLIANSNEISFLSMNNSIDKFNQIEAKRLNDIYQFTVENFRNKISLDRISTVANVSVSSFCRYFKTKTKKTYSQYLIELRVQNACKLLIENRFTISDICYACGFNNFSNFNRFFKQITGFSPLQYKKDFTKFKRL